MTTVKKQKMNPRLIYILLPKGDMMKKVIFNLEPLSYKAKF